MTDLDEHGRPEPPIAADETATLLGFLEYQRATFAWKCAGLDAAGLQAKVAASSMTLEYARHNGHADLIRESVDGLTGE
jgi:Protein of unknown function (DUF664)